MEREKAVDCLGKIMIAVNESGINHAHFIGYGTLLGAIRENGPIGHDMDMDVCILADKITKEQELAYFEGCRKQGLFGDREKVAKRADTDRFLWFSLREKPDTAKCCNWFQTPYNGYYFHSKGEAWVSNIGPRCKPEVGVQQAVAIMKGIPIRCFDELIPFNFCGINVNIPKRYGTCLDYWYVNWKIPKAGGSSLEDMLLIIDTWKSNQKWTMRHKTV